MSTFLEKFGYTKERLNPSRAGVKRVAIDTNWFMMSRISVLWKSNCLSTVIDDDFYTFMYNEIVNSAFSTMSKMRDKGVNVVIWCFDGKKDPNKTATAKRLAVAEKTRAKLDTYKKGSREYNELLKRNPIIKPGMAKEIYKLFVKYGLSVCLDPECSEGERLCSRLCLNNMVDAVVTTDTDVMAMGVRYIIADLSSWLCYDMHAVLEKMKEDKGFTVSTKMFRDACILMGCDFNERIKQFGPARIYAAMTTENRRLKEIVTKKGVDGECLNVEICKNHFDATNNIEASMLIDQDMKSIKLAAEQPDTFPSASVYYKYVTAQIENDTRRKADCVRGECDDM